MLKTQILTLAVLTAVGLTVTACAQATQSTPNTMGEESYPQFTSKVGTEIYSPGPLIPMQEFKLEMKMAHPSMNVIKKDYNSGKKLSCTMVPAGTNNDMAILDCTPE